MQRLRTDRVTSFIKIIVILVLFSSFAQAKNPVDKLPAFQRQLASVGIAYRLTENNLFVFIAPQKLMKTVPKLQKKGLVNPHLTQAEMSFYQPLLPAALSIRYVANLVEKMYLTEHNIDQLSIAVYVLTPDPYGNNTQAFCYSFDFDRELYQKINWKKFQADNLKRIAPNFKTSALCRNLIETDPTTI